MKYWYNRIAKIDVVVYNLKHCGKVRLFDNIVLVHDKNNNVILLIVEKENQHDFSGEVKAIIKNEKDLIHVINILI